MSAALPVLLLCASALQAQDPARLKADAEGSFLSLSGGARAVERLAMEYVSVPLPSEVSLDEGDAKARRVRITFPGRGYAGPDRSTPDNVLHLAVPASLGPGESAPFILMLPMSLDVDYRVSRWLCNGLIKQGFRCAYLERSTYQAPHVEDMAGAMGFPPESALSARQALDVLQEMGYLEDDAKVGVAGVSLGAIDAALVAATDPRVGAVAMLLGGGNLPKMLVSMKGIMTEIYTAPRDRQLKEQGLTCDALEARMRTKLRGADPLTYFENPAYPVNRDLTPERFLMINIEGDPTVVNDCSNDLARALTRNGRQPDYEWLVAPLIPGPLKHVGSFTMILHAQKRMAQHFKRHLSAP
jgi:pimeloyl-ACP methyl ester carboxylesterase